MRVHSLLAGLAAGAFGVLALTGSASAFGKPHSWDLFQAPEGYAWPHHSGLHKKKLYHLGSPDDPYAYRYAKRKYYPYYGSHYWVPAAEMRYRYRYGFHGPKYVYHPAWGYNKGHGHSHDHGHHGGHPTK